MEDSHIGNKATKNDKANNSRAQMISFFGAPRLVPLSQEKDCIIKYHIYTVNRFLYSPFPRYSSSPRNKVLSRSLPIGLPLKTSRTFARDSLLRLALGVKPEPPTTASTNALQAMSQLVETQKAPSLSGERKSIFEKALRTQSISGGPIPRLFANKDGVVTATTTASTIITTTSTTSTSTSDAMLAHQQMPTTPPTTSSNPLSLYPIPKRKADDTDHESPDRQIKRQKTEEPTETHHIVILPPPLCDHLTILPQIQSVQRLAPSTPEKLQQQTTTVTKRSREEEVEAQRKRQKQDNEDTVHAVTDIDTANAKIDDNNTKGGVILNFGAQAVIHTPTQENSTKVNRNLTTN